MPPTIPLTFLADYALLEELSPGQTYLALSPANQKVVLKRLDDDCLFESRLHVSIKERLERIQQIPHIGVANLLGVERVADHAFLVWEYLEGPSLDTYLSTPDSAGRYPSLTDTGRDLVLCVERLARLGLVHGDLHARNIFVTPAGIRLTHLSPYLYTDPQEDARAVVELLLDSLNKRYQPGDLPAHRLLTRALDENYPLATLVPLLACPPDSPLSPLQMTPRRKRTTGRRTRSVALALVLLLLGAAFTLATLHHFGYSNPRLHALATHLDDWWQTLLHLAQRARPGRV